mgnify:CR=1 FL=1
MKVLDQVVFDEWRNTNSGDPYGAEIFRYATAWADLMEARMAGGESLVSIADATSKEANTSGITGFMYGAAVSVLAKCWEHGDTLRRWHNKEVQLGTEGDAANESDGVLNPALLTIG